MGKYLGDITELAKAAVKDFKGKKPSHKDMGNWLADKLGEPKNTYGSQDFVDTLDSVYNEYDFWNDDYEDGDDKLDNEIVNDKTLDAIKDNFTPPGAESQEEELKDEIDTNDNGKIEVDEMADFQKSLDDYASKNKKGRDDIPVTTRR